VRIETERLILRDWLDEDIPRYAAIIGDPQVRRFFVELGTYADAETGIARARERLAVHGYTMNAVERKADGAFMGMLGIAPLKDNMQELVRGRPEAEIGW
jgi:RimJ/RimL family protein N-acetyltransferase